MKCAVSYCAETGTFTWLQRPVSHFKNQMACNSWNSRWAGKVAGNKRMHKGVKICGNLNISGTLGGLMEYRCLYPLHRLAISMCGIIMDDNLPVDHINRDPWDNRLCNLRIATDTQNNRNRGVYKNNKSGYKGVSLDGSMYRAVIHSGGRQISRSGFTTPEQAASAYNDMAKEHFGKYAVINALV